MTIYRRARQSLLSFCGKNLQFAKLYSFFKRLYKQKA